MLIPFFCTGWATWPVVSVYKNEFWMNELVFDFKNGHVWHTLVKLAINSFSRYSSEISILRADGVLLSVREVCWGRYGSPLKGSLGAKKWEKKSSSSSHCLHCSFSGKIEMSTDSTLRWNTK